MPRQQAGIPARPPGPGEESMSDERKALREAVSRFMPPRTAADFCDDNARRVGRKEALVDSRRRLTWERTAELSDALALGLLDLGLERDARVLIQMPNSAELFLARLACEKAGLRLVTAAPSLRRAELGPIVRFTRPEAAIVPAAYRGFRHLELLEQVRVPELRHVLAAWDEVPRGCLSLEQVLSAPVPDRARRRLAATRYGVEDVCQLATTSGSTGLPKCAAVPLYTRLLTAWSHVKRFRVDHGDTLCAVTAIISGVADGLIYNGACQTGARVVLMDRFDPRRTCETVARERVNVLPLVPTMISRLLALDDLRGHDLDSLRMVVSHGSLLPRELGVEAESRLGCRIMQGYGSVDCGGLCATSWDDPPDVRIRSVGRPLEGNELRIVDEGGNRVRPGAPGRLWVRGLPSDARFFRNPELDARRRSDGFLDLQEWGRMDERGNVYLMGRDQDLIIRGGRNVFPADLEDLLVRCPGVKEAAVVGYADADLGEGIAACVVPEEGARLTLEGVREFLRQQGLAPFKRPDRLESMDGFPRVASGDKVDKRALRERVGGSRTGNRGNLEQLPPFVPRPNDCPRSS